jgi:hypothetical protein
MVRKFLDKVGHAGAPERAEDRESTPVNIELVSSSEPMRQIVDRNDPVVVFDRAHKRLISEATLAAWQRACVWMAGVLSVPAPGADFNYNGLYHRTWNHP